MWVFLDFDPYSDGAPKKTITLSWIASFFIINIPFNAVVPSSQTEHN